jgi:hypothetical protein
MAEGLASGEASRAAIASAAGAATGMGDPDTDPATVTQQEQGFEYHDCTLEDTTRCLLHAKKVAAIAAERITLVYFGLLEINARTWMICLELRSNSGCARETR